MSADFLDRHGSETVVALNKLLGALDDLYFEGWRVHNQECFRLTNGTTDLDLWYDPDDGWYFDEEQEFG